MSQPVMYAQSLRHKVKLRGVHAWRIGAIGWRSAAGCCRAQTHSINICQSDGISSTQRA
eukprot:SAG11_NODE_19488_length_465_cov_1.571038_2_plen_58_part_01